MLDENSSLTYTKLDVSYWFDVAKIKVILKTRCELLGKCSSSLFHPFLFSRLFKSKTLLVDVSILSMQKAPGYFVGSTYTFPGDLL